MLPIPWKNFHVPLNMDAHPTSMFSRTMRCNLAILTEDHKNKLESAGLKDNYYVVGINAILYQECGVLINIVSKKDTGDMSLCTCLNFTEMSSQSLCYDIMCLDFCARWITTVTSSFTLQRSPTIRSCGYLNLQVL